MITMTKVTTTTKTFMVTLLTNISAPVTHKIMRDRWVCNVCGTMSFDEFNEAYLHKKEFL